jgi:hypothetical protein
MMLVYQSSLLGDENEEQEAAGFKPILDASLNPLTEMSQKMAELLISKDSGRDMWAHDIFICNCLAYIMVSRIVFHSF